MTQRESNMQGLRWDWYRSLIRLITNEVNVFLEYGIYFIFIFSQEIIILLMINNYKTIQKKSNRSRVWEYCRTRTKYNKGRMWRRKWESSTSNVPTTKKINKEQQNEDTIKKIALPATSCPYRRQQVEPHTKE